MDILQIDHLSKAFGKHTVIDDLSFSVPEHSVFGFLGQNGAGKTTTMKMILGLIKSDSGNIGVCGEKVAYGQTATNKYIGYLPDVPEFYSYMNSKEYLRLCGEITGMTSAEINAKSEELLALVGLDGISKRIGSFSRGMKQRLGIAQALLNSPKLLICDEPTSALDPIGRKEILDILHQVKGKTTVVFSTHILSDVERICDRVALLHHGNLSLCGTLSEIKAQHKQDTLLLEFKSDADRIRFISSANFQPLIASTDAAGNCLVVKCQNIESAEASIIEILAETKILPIRIEILEPTLESLFMEVTA